MTLALATSIVLAADLGTRGGVRLADAQQSQSITISVASLVQAEPASRVRLPIQVGPPGAIAKNSFIRVRGLPPATALSDGYAISPGAWAVPLAALPTLTIIVPVGVQGQSDVAISLVGIEGAVLAEAKTVLVVAPAPSASGHLEPQPSGAPLGPIARELSTAERERALGLHAIGQQQLGRGNVYAARKFFERAAEAGLAQSALALADTYDPDELAKLKVVGLQPDIEAARKWYERARELGAVEAVERLRRLGAR